MTKIDSWKQTAPCGCTRIQYSNGTVSDYDVSECLDGHTEADWQTDKKLPKHYTTKNVRRTA